MAIQYGFTYIPLSENSRTISLQLKFGSHECNEGHAQFCEKKWQNYLPPWNLAHWKMDRLYIIEYYYYFFIYMRRSSHRKLLTRLLMGVSIDMNCSKRYKCWYRSIYNGSANIVLIYHENWIGALKTENRAIINLGSPWFESNTFIRSMVACIR